MSENRGSMKIEKHDADFNDSIRNKSDQIKEQINKSVQINEQNNKYGKLDIQFLSNGINGQRENRRIDATAQPFFEHE